MADIVAPTVHLNGTSKESLLEQATNAYEACTALWKALGEASPHGRDYYMQGPGAFARAQADHIERLRKVEAIRADMMALACAIQDQGENRRK